MFTIVKRGPEQRLMVSAARYIGELRIEQQLFLSYAQLVYKMIEYTSSAALL